VISTEDRQVEYCKWTLPMLVAMGLLGACASNPTPHSPTPNSAAQPAAKTAAPAGSAAQGASLNPDAAKAATAAAVKQVIATEQAFAKTMADRNFKGFITFLSPDAVFFSGAKVQHGPAEVAVQWQPYFDGPKAPFSWAPDHVEVLASGNLALSTGPIYEKGNIIGRFNSIWRLEPDHAWRIVFDKGEAVCSARP